MPWKPPITKGNLKAANEAFGVARKKNPPGFMSSGLRGQARRMYMKMSPGELESFVHKSAKELKKQNAG